MTLSHVLRDFYHFKKNLLKYKILLENSMEHTQDGEQYFTSNISIAFRHIKELY